MQPIHWYPGHIAKAQRQLKERLTAVDCVIEMVDARLPIGSHFDFVDELLGSKPRVLALNKTDLAPMATVQQGLCHWEALGFPCVALHLLQQQGLAQLKKHLHRLGDKLAEKMRARGRLPRRLRLMIMGLPNVGKSSLINTLIGKRSMKVANKPGVTRQMQWVSIAKDWELLDTPGVIPLKLADQDLALKLALIGSVSEQAYDPMLATRMALDLLRRVQPGFLQQNFGTEALELEQIAAARQFLVKGGELDLERAGRTFFSEIRTGKLGLLALEEVKG